MRNLPLTTVIAFSALALAGCASDASPDSTPSPTPTSNSFTARGSITTSPDIFYHPPGTTEHTLGEECISMDNYDDIDDGAQVVIEDAEGKTVGLGTLSAGRLTAPADATSTSMLEAGCEFSFTATVESTSQFFGVRAGNESRGTVQYAKTDLTSGVELTLKD